MSIELIHSDDSILIVNKPAGLSVLPDGWVANAPYLRKLLEDERGPIWVVHRLDKVTSGVMVLARNAAAHRHLNRQFEHHQVQKVYHAIGRGLPVHNEFTANHPLTANIGHRHRTSVDFKRGKPASTCFRVLERFAACSLLEAIPKTGRTHQIRAHAAALDHPLLGDTLYGSPTTDLIARPALHACSLTFIHPASGESVSFSSPYPEDMLHAIACLRSRE